MKNCCTITLTLAAAVLLLTACGQPQSTKSGPNSDIRTISGMHTLGGAGNVTMQAARACDKENKKLIVISTTTQNGIYSGTSYPVIVFRCE